MRRHLFSCLRLCSASLLLFVVTASSPTAQQVGAPQVQTTRPAPPANPSSSQASPTLGNGAISGVVIDATTKTPIAGAVVSISASNGRPLVTGQQNRQMTDSKGRFIFPGLGAWSGYTITASKLGYFDGAYGSDRPGTASRLIPLTDGQWFQTAQIGLLRGSSISGRVTDERGEPVVGVFVRVLPRMLAAGQQRVVAGPIAVSDDRGVYRVSGLGAGRYLVQVPSVQASVPAALPSYAIAGLTAESAARSSQPLPVEAALDLDPSTKLILNKYPTPPPSPDGRAWTYPITFHPGTAQLTQALAIELKTGEDRLNADIRLEPAPTSKITGVVQGPGDAMAGLTLRLVPVGLEDLGQGSEAATALVGENGAFGFLNVPPGSYTIFAARAVSEYTYNGSPFISGLPGPPTKGGSSSVSNSVDSAPAGTQFLSRATGTANNNSYWVRTPVTVAAGRDTIDLGVPLLRTVSMSGRIIFESVDPMNPGTPPAQAGRALGVEPATGAAWLAATSNLGQSKEAPPGEFLIDGLMGGDYVFKPGFVTGWTLKSITVNGRDVTYSPLDTSSGVDITGALATFTNATTALTGSVSHAQPGPLEAAVIVFPAERDQWTNYGMRSQRIKSQRVSNAGTYSFASLPAGTYLVVAVTPAELNAWQDPAFLARAEGNATRVSLAWGDKKSVDLRVAGR